MRCVLLSRAAWRARHVRRSARASAPATVRSSGAFARRSDLQLVIVLFEFWDRLLGIDGSLQCVLAFLQLDILEADFSLLAGTEIDGPVRRVAVHGQAHGDVLGV